MGTMHVGWWAIRYFPARISMTARERIAVMGRVCLRCPVFVPEAQNMKSADSGTSACKSLWDRAARVCHVQTGRHRSGRLPRRRDDADAANMTSFSRRKVCLQRWPFPPLSPKAIVGEEPWPAIWRGWATLGRGREGRYGASGRAIGCGSPHGRTWATTADV